MEPFQYRYHGKFHHGVGVSTGGHPQGGVLVTYQGGVSVALGGGGGGTGVEVGLGVRVGTSTARRTRRSA